MHVVLCSTFFARTSERMSCISEGAPLAAGFHTDCRRISATARPLGSFGVDLLNDVLGHLERAEPGGGGGDYICVNGREVRPRTLRSLL